MRWLARGACVYDVQFMMQEEQDAIVGRVVREKREKETKLACLRAEADRLGRVFSQLGEILRANPEDVVVVNMSDSRPGTFKAEDISTNRLTELTDEIRKTTQELEQIADT